MLHTQCRHPADDELDYPHAKDVKGTDKEANRESRMQKKRKISPNRRKSQAQEVTERKRAEVKRDAGAEEHVRGSAGARQLPCKTCVKNMSVASSCGR